MFRQYCHDHGVENPRITKNGRADRRCPRMVELENEWFRGVVIGDKCPKEIVVDTCPICYETLSDKNVKTECNHTFCISCYTQSVRESDDCPMCRAPLSGVKPKKSAPMDPQVSFGLLSDFIQQEITPFVVNLYDTIIHDHTEIERLLSERPDTRDNRAREDARLDLIGPILRMITERYMTFGYNILHRSNMWHTNTSGYPYDPIRLVGLLPYRSNE